MALILIWKTLPNESNEYDPETDTILMMTRKTRPNNGRLMSAPYQAQAQGPPCKHHFLDIPHTLYFLPHTLYFPT